MNALYSNNLQGVTLHTGVPAAIATRELLSSKGRDAGHLAKKASARCHNRREVAVYEEYNVKG